MFEEDLRVGVRLDFRLWHAGAEYTGEPTVVRGPASLAPCVLPPTLEAPFLSAKIRTESTGGQLLSVNTLILPLNFRGDKHVSA